MEKKIYIYFAEHDIYFGEQMFTLVNINLELKSALRTKYLFCRTLLYMFEMACRHIPTMTKSHHGGEMSVMIKVGMCQCQIPTIHDKLQLPTVIISEMFKSSPVLRHKTQN